ncbi:hypothetical protein OSB04_002254 [Centaurea solstitialis]|uniref:Uncharacterized protein n=1 Tax=Centaurea solstitialis TaxID=347529 RepID=A0AA38UB38_9ASTR|nr:hypothetical protein OSB04_002254 [Centaurea solstitialis]
MGLSLDRSIIVIALLVFGMWACNVRSRTRSRERNVIQDIQGQCGVHRIIHNGDNRGYKLSVNEFADQTNEELKAVRNGFKVPSGFGSGQTTSFMYEYVNEVPSSMDGERKGLLPQSRIKVNVDIR